ncbi:MAG TPA: DnaJ domain-containing protein [Ktedonobacterales bacterium]|nr:DnaJ domain-containing protein [Ktedonobacterales bacterium]
MRNDFYAVLGVSPSASADEIRQAYRARAWECHPDRKPDDAVAAAQFKVINEAYRVLGTPRLRSAYDSALRMLQAHTPPRLKSDGGAPPYQTSYGAARPGEAPGSSRPTPSGILRGDDPMTEDGAEGSPGLALALTVTPGEPNIIAPHENARFYMLTELGSARESALLDPLPLDLALLVDRSNSMKGDKIFEAKRAVKRLFNYLRPDDLVTIIFFDDRPETVADAVSVSGRGAVEMAIDSVYVRGSTRIADGLEETLRRLMTRHTGRLRSRVASLMLLTDGLTVGDEARCYQLATEARHAGISITALGIGLEWNRELLDRIAAISGGSCNFVEHPRETSTIFDECIHRVRATLAADMRLTFTPAPGVGVVRATRVAPEIAEAFSMPPTQRDVFEASLDPVTVDLGALVGRPDVESAVVAWDMLLDGKTLTPSQGRYTLGTLRATYWAPRQGGGRWEQLERVVTLPANTTGRHSAVASDVQLALELITAFRLQTNADRLVSAGAAAEAITQLNTSALRLRAAGDKDMADEAKRAADSLSGALSSGRADAMGPGRTATLRVKYDTKNLSLFHRLRRKLAAREWRDRE